MRRLALTIVPLLFLACEREPTAPALPTLSVNRRTEIVRDVSDIVVGFNLGSCGAFDILADWNALVQLAFYYDGDGNLVRQHVHYRVVGRSRYYNSVDPQVGVLGGPGEIQNTRFDFVNNTLTFSGLPWKIRLAGYGTIFFETGLSVIDLTTGIITRDTGQNQFNAGDFAALCDALTP